MGSNARMDPKLPSKFWDVSWPPPPTPSSKTFFTCHIEYKNYSYQIIYCCLILREVQAFHFGKNNFELGVGGDGQDMSCLFEGSFGSIRAILPM